MTNDNNNTDNRFREAVSKAGVKKFAESVTKALEAMDQTDQKLAELFEEFARKLNKMDVGAMKPYGDLLRGLGQDDVLRQEVQTKLNVTKQKFGEPMSNDQFNKVFDLPVHQAKVPEKKSDRGFGLGSEIGGADSGG